MARRGVSGNGKGRAFSLHLLISASVLSLLLFLVRYLWFPMPYFVADGGWQGTRIVAAITLVLGPVLTLVVHRRGKSRRALLLDYGVISLLQVTALAFGVWTVFSQRTVLMVFADGSFYSVDAQSAVRMGESAASIRTASPSSPAYAVVPMPDDPDQRQQMRVDALQTGRALYTRGELLQPLDAKRLAALRAYELDIVSTAGDDPGRRKELEDFRAAHEEDWEDLVFLPATCSYRTLVLALHRDDGRLGGWLNIPSGPQHKLKHKPPRVTAVPGAVEEGEL